MANQNLDLSPTPASNTPFAAAEGTIGAPDPALARLQRGPKIPRAAMLRLALAIAQAQAAAPRGGNRQGFLP